MFQYHFSPFFISYEPLTVRLALDVFFGRPVSTGEFPNSRSTNAGTARTTSGSNSWVWDAKPTQNHALYIREIPVWSP